jgi:F-type H+-transporting ATPase subunit alpha
VIFAGTNGYLDDIPVNDVGRYEQGMLNFLRSNHQDLLDWITNEDPKIKGEASDKIKAVLDAYSEGFS